MRGKNLLHIYKVDSEEGCDKHEGEERNHPW